MSHRPSSNLLIFLAACLLLLAGFGAAWNYRLQPQPVALTPSISGQPEYCLSCHTGLEEISPSHPVETFGCVSCHGGERLALDADLAHSTMRGGKNPSDLAVVQESCGGSGCHDGDQAAERDHIARVMTSVQSTYAGAIASIRYTFGAQAGLDAHQAIAAVADQDGFSATGLMALSAFDPGRETSPAVLAFAQNCLSCHIGAEPVPGLEYARLTGCAACHTPTAGVDLEAKRQAGQPIHRLTTAIPYTQCNTCHNRGNYDLRDISFQARSDHPTDRLNDYYQPIAQFTRCEYVLDCIDCHTRDEVMGDGDLHNNQKEIQYVQCSTCHGTLDQAPHTQVIGSTEDIALRMAFLNPFIELNLGDVILVTEKQEPMWNIRRLADNSFELTAKATGARYNVPQVMGTACEQNPGEQESRYCHACHAVEH